jgi:hypothetical protein
MGLVRSVILYPLNLLLEEKNLLQIESMLGGVEYEQSEYFSRYPGKCSNRPGARQGIRVNTETVRIRSKFP